MRKLILIILAMLIPFGLWTAGCRQNSRVAAFPSTPEMKNIARAPESDYATRPPVIPAAIDREVLNTPDQPTFARIRAVMDRSEILTNRPSDPGLFLLPPQDDLTLAQHQPPAQIYHPAPAERPPVSYQAAAPMPPAPAAREFWSRPAAPVPPGRPLQQSVPHGVSAMMPAAAPVPVPAPALMPEDIPGIFLGPEEIPGIPLSLRSPGTAPGLPPALTPAAFGPAPVSDAALPAPAQLQAWRPLQGGPDLDLVSLLTPAKSPPETEANAFPGEENRLSAYNDLRQALAPLPDISALARPEPEEPPLAAMAVPAVSLFPESVPGSSVLSGDAEAAAPEAAAKPEDTGPSLPLPLPNLADLMPLPPAGETPELPAPETNGEDSEPAALFEEILKAAPPAAAADEPAPKTAVLLPLEPVKRSPVTNTLRQIDAETAVPPLRF